MREPRQTGLDPTTLLIAAAVGLLLYFLAGVLFAQATTAGAGLDPRAALKTSQAAVGKTIGDYTLVDVDGRQLRLAEYRGKPLVVSFIYTGAAGCPTTTKFPERAIDEAERRGRMYFA
jgi:protein SCO1/2